MTPSDRAQISVPTPVWRQLTALKEKPGETYAQVIMRLITHYEEGEHDDGSETPNGEGCPTLTAITGV